MKTITTTVYKFNELSEEAQRTAIQILDEVNVSYDWWEYNYEDAENVGIDIAGFNLDHGDITIKYNDSIKKTMEAILTEHGETCDTYQIAKRYLTELKQLEQQYKGIDLTNKLSFVDPDYTEQLEKCYLKLLREEYEYRTGKEAITETILSNDYDFTEDGNLYATYKK